MPFAVDHCFVKNTEIAFFLCEVLCGQEGLSGLRKGGRTFGILGLQGQLDGYLVQFYLKGSFTQQGMAEIESIFEGFFKFATSAENKFFDSTDSADWVAIGERPRSDFE